MATATITKQWDTAYLRRVRCARRPSWIPQVAMKMQVSDATVDNEAQLLAAYARGEQSAARSLADRLLPRIMGQAVRMLQDRAEAEDVAQEAMLKLWKVAPNWDPSRGRVTTWIFRVVANLCTDRLRRRRGVGLDDIAEPTDPSPSAAAALQNVSRANALSWGLAQLPERQAQAVALRHLEGLSNPEIAEIMDIGTRAVESLTARGKSALTQLLTDRRSELGYHDD